MMRRFAYVAMTIAVCSGPAAAADDAEPSVLGKVAGIYVRAGQHLLVETSIAHRVGNARPAPGRMVAEIRFARPLEDGRSGTLAKVDDSCMTTLDTGDVVKVALTESKGGSQSTAPMRRSDEVRTVEAKYHTETAQAFGLTNGSSWAALGSTPGSTPGRTQVAQPKVTDLFARQ